MKKKVLALLLAIVIVLLGILPASAQTVNGWQLIDNHWYYCKSNGKLANFEFLTLNGKEYFFDALSRMVTGFYMPTGYEAGVGNRRSLIFADGSGAIAKTEGWYKLNGDWYYLKKDGSFAKNELLEINYSSYIFKDNYKMHTEGLAVVLVNDSALPYFTTSSGAVAKSGWVNDGPEWYYADDNGVLYQNKWLEENGNKYYFLPAMVTGVHYIQGFEYYFNEYGIMTKRLGNTIGWDLVDGKWYYYKYANLSFTGFVDEYYIEDNVMVTNSLKTIGENTYYFGCDGKIQTGWILNNGTWYYALENGNLFNSGWKLIDNAWYLFEDTKMLADCVVYSSEYGNFCEFGATGAFIGYANTGWYRTYNGGWYWLESDATMPSGAKTIGSITYYFEKGKMLQNSCVKENNKYFWINNDGVKDFGTGWRYNGNYYYLENGSIQHGTANINNNDYYLYPEMYIGYHELYNNQKLQYDDMLFGESGAKQNISTGWYSINRNGKVQWYYAQNGNICRDGTYLIGGRQYAFLYDGIMCENNVYPSQNGGANYLYGDNGVLIQNGWVYNNGWYYAGVNGIVYTGQRTIFGKTYWFDDNGLLIK